MVWLLVLVTGAQAATPYDALSSASPGARVRLAPGLTLTPSQISRDGTTIRVRAGRLRIGGVATGRGVRAVATPAGVRIVGGRFAVAKSLTDREYTVSGDAPITVTQGADGAPRVTGGRLAILPARKARAKVRASADVSEPQVEQALPAAPGGQRWRFGFGLNSSGVVVRVFLGDAQVGSGLVRYDGSYRVSLGLTDYPVLGAKVSAAGDVAGDSLSDPAPVVGIAGRVDGQMQVARNVSVGDGTVNWDTDGLEVDATAKLACPDGGIAADAQGTVTSDADWNFKVSGQPNGDTCAVADNAQVVPQSVGGELTSTAGAVTGEITAATGERDSIKLDRNGTALIGPSLKYSLKGVTLEAGLYLPCPAGGGVTALVDVTLPYDLSFKSWSVGVHTRTSSGGCTITDELTLQPDTAIDLTISQKGGRLGVDMSVVANIATTLIPTKTYFKVVFRLSARAGDFSGFVSAETDGAAFSGAVKSDGTFDFQFAINDLKIANTTFKANGHITRKDPHAKTDIDFQTSLDGNIPLDDNFAIRGFSLGIVGNDLTFLGVIRMKCTEGYYDLAASGEVLAKGDFRLDIDGMAGNCRVGNLLRFDGQAWDGTLAWANGALDVDIKLAIASMSLPAMHDRKFGDLKMDLYGTTALITNRCTDGCGPEKLRIDLDGRTKIATNFPFGPGPILLDARLHVKLDLDGVIATTFYLGLTDIYMNGEKSTLSVEITGELKRAIGKGFAPKAPPAEAPKPEADGDLTGASVGGRTFAPAVRALKVRVSGDRPVIDVTLTKKGAASVEVQRRECRASCRWTIVTFKVVRANSRGVARFRPVVGLRAGSYRAVARGGAAGSGKAKVRRFRVR